MPAGSDVQMGRYRLTGACQVQTAVSHWKGKREKKCCAILKKKISFFFFMIEPHVALSGLKLLILLLCFLSAGVTDKGDPLS